MMTNQTATVTREQLFEDYKRAHRVMEAAAFSLAYDVTIRADDPTGVKTGHQPASIRLTQFLKAEYVAAHEADRVAYDRWAESTPN